MDKKVIFTIGHSTHKLGYFLELLKHWKVTCVVDVRSVPSSRFNPQFAKAVLSNVLKLNDIAYVHMGEEFGARITAPELLDLEGQVDFKKVQNSLGFKNGIERLNHAVDKGFVIALMCAESDPLNCHRFSMITPILKNEGFEVRHILKDKTTLSTERLEQLMLAKFHKSSRKGLFPDKTDQHFIDAAYQRLGKTIAFTPNRSINK